MAGPYMGGEDKGVARVGGDAPDGPSGGLLDSTTFPARGADGSSGVSPILERSAPTVRGPLDTDIHAEVLRGVRRTQAAPLSGRPPTGGDLRRIDAYPAMNYAPSGRFAPPRHEAMVRFALGLPIPKEAYGPVITFRNDEPRNPSPDQPVTDRTATMVERGVVDSGVGSVNINSTTGGKHASNSRHYQKRGVDIDIVDGRPVSSGHMGSRQLQDAMSRQPNIRENFGPDFQSKTVPGRGPAPWPQAMERHDNHDHFSGQD